MEVKLRDAAISPDPKASRTRRTNWEKRQEDLKHLVENYDNLSTKKYMGYLVDFFNHTLSLCDLIHILKYLLMLEYIDNRFNK